MIILRGLIPVFIAYVIYKRGKRAYGNEIKNDIEKLLNKPVPRSLVYGTLKRMERYGIIEKRQVERKMSYELNERGVIFLVKHVEILRYFSPIITHIVDDMDKELNKGL